MPWNNSYIEVIIIDTNSGYKLNSLPFSVLQFSTGYFDKVDPVGRMISQ